MNGAASPPLPPAPPAGGDSVPIAPASPAPAPAPPLLELRDVRKAFAGVLALDRVDFDLRAGEVHGLVGENGAGKSTLMKIVAGVHPAFEGEMRLDGRPARFRSPKDARAAGIGMVHQELSIAPDLTVAENVFLGAQPVSRLGLVDWGAMRRGAARQLAALGVEVDPGARAGSLPLGLQQLVELGRVLFGGARAVILDEPTSALSPPEVRRLFEVLARLKAGGRTFVFISHFLEDVLAVSDRVTVFRNARKVATADAAAVDKTWVIHRMIGRGHERLEGALEGEVLLDGPAAAPAILTARGLGRRGAFAGVDLEVRAGEVLGLYGFMGAGQLEVAKALMGKLPAEAGAVAIGGARVRLRSTSAAKRAGVGMVPESRRAMLFSAEPVYKNVSIGLLGRIAPVLLRPAEERRIARARVEGLRIRPASVEPEVRTLSGGNQQKVALARWLTDLPRVLVLSEPTRGMDVGAKEDVVRIVRDLRTRGVGVVVASSEPETVLTMADRILVMRRGRIAHEFARTRVGKDALLAAA